jgi:peptidoglycan/LPS O-acetylase OafA/YrhL
VRADIQGLRALAVGVVLLYHFWPKLLGGGYVGVDVFFVISGFLITDHLLRHPPHCLRDVGEFWGRRIRRLVPAATLVLVTTAAAAYVWLPVTVLPALAEHVGGSSLYMENWLLAGSSTDYLAAGELPGAVQHFWSLSVEEQFYIFWPILVGGIAMLTVIVRSRNPRARNVLVAVPVGGLGLVAAASLAWSVWFTRLDAAGAYFVTTTRVWELALGGVLAACARAGWLPHRRSVRRLGAWVGLLMIVYAAITFDDGTAFPGSAALVPVGGAVAVIAARSDGLAGGPFRIWASRPVQWCGDNSYSVYLWHWPVLLIAPFALDVTLRWPHKLVLLMIVFLIAAATKRCVEDGLQFRPTLARSLARTYLLLAFCLSVSLGAAGALWLVTRPSSGDSALRLDGRCLGAAALREAACDPGTTRALISPTYAKTDKSDVYRDDCWANKPFTRRKVCTYGRPDSAVRVALIGNSHAGHWHPPIRRAVETLGARLDTYLVSECYPVDLPISFSSERLEKNCAGWSTWATGRIRAGDYDLVIMSSRTFQPLVGVAADQQIGVAREAYTRVIKSFVAAGGQVLVLRDTPSASGNIPDCVASHPADLARCAEPVASALEPDPLADAGRQFDSGVAVLDLHRLLCTDDICPAVVGGLIKYFDHGHMTKTFAETLYPEVFAAIKRQVSAR